MLAATFNGNPRTTIISCYSPTNVSEEIELVAFYDELSSLVHSILKHNMLVIGGDMNAQIGKNGNNKYSLHNTSNRNGQNLTDFMIENRLTCLNTNYQKREGKLWTYTYANNSKAQIDYVFINKKWKNSTINCEAYSTFEDVSFDHRIVTAKIRLSLRKNDTRTATTKHYDWALLNNRDIRDKYVVELRNRFETRQEKTEKSIPNDEYENSTCTSRQQQSVFQQNLELNIESMGNISGERKTCTHKNSLQKPKVTHEPITKIISKQLDIKLGPFTQKELDSVLRKIKNRKAAGLDEIPPEVRKTRQFDDILLRHCNAVYNQNPIDG